ncbi:MAG: tetratricopeptide repeat protein, partial [bacterium]
MLLFPVGLAASPGTIRAARALTLQAEHSNSLSRATALLQRAMRLGRRSQVGSRAALELAELDYTAGRSAQALAALRKARTWPRADASRPDWRYWGGQIHLALRQWREALVDFKGFLRFWPGNARADAARLGEADCLEALGRHTEARALYQILTADKGAFAAQALWGLGDLAQTEGRNDEAQSDFARLLK